MRGGALGSVFGVWRAHWLCDGALGCAEGYIFLGLMPGTPLARSTCEERMPIP